MCSSIFPPLSGAGLSTLNEGQKLSFEVERGQQGKLSAGNLKVD